MTSTNPHKSERITTWPAAIAVALLCAMFLGTSASGASKREHHRWSEIIQTWDGQYLKIKQHSSQNEYHGSHFFPDPDPSGGGDPRHETQFTVGGKDCRWEGAYIPIAIQPDKTGVYMAVYDRETPGGSSRFRLYRSRSATAWDEIGPKDFPKHLAIQNTWLSESNGSIDGYGLVEKMDPAEPWFRTSLTANLWNYLEKPEFSMDRDPSEESVRQFKAKWIKSQAPASPPPAKLTSMQRAYDFDATIANFTETIRRNPKDVVTIVGRGSSYAIEGYYQKALADFDEALRIDPKDSHAYRGRGVVYRRMGELDKAIADFSESVRLTKEPATASMSLGGRGLAYELKGDHDRAMADLNEAIRLYPKNAKAYYARGLVGLHTGNLDKAIADLNEAIRLNPADEEAYYGRGLAYEKQGKKTEAEKDSEQASRLGYKPQ